MLRWMSQQQKKRRDIYQDGHRDYRANNDRCTEEITDDPLAAIDPDRDGTQKIYAVSRLVLSFINSFLHPLLNTSFYIVG